MKSAYINTAHFEITVTDTARPILAMKDAPSFERRFLTLEKTFIDLFFYVTVKDFDTVKVYEEMGLDLLANITTSVVLKELKKEFNIVVLDPENPIEGFEPFMVDLNRDSLPFSASHTVCSRYFMYIPFKQMSSLTMLSLEAMTVTFRHELHNVISIRDEFKKNTGSCKLRISIGSEGSDIQFINFPGSAAILDISIVDSDDAWQPVENGYDGSNNPSFLLNEKDVILNESKNTKRVLNIKVRTSLATGILSIADHEKAAILQECLILSLDKLRQNTFLNKDVINQITIFMNSFIV
jgi:hypothetical protein